MSKQPAESRSPSARTDHWPTLAAVAGVAYLATIQSHEILGHGLVALWCGGRSFVLSSIALSTDIANRAIPAGGPALNLLLAAAVAPFVVRTSPRSVVSAALALHLFAFNLFIGTGYFLFCGLTGAGDLAAVVGGLEPAWAWRAGLGVVGAAGYSGSIRLVSVALGRFAAAHGGGSRRGWILMFMPYVVSVLVAAIGAVRSPVGLSQLWIYALPSTLLGNVGFLVAWHIWNDTPASPDRALDRIRPHWPWIVAGALLVAVFALVIGPGVTIRF